MDVGRSELTAARDFTRPFDAPSLAPRASLQAFDPHALIGRAFDIVASLLLLLFVLPALLPIAILIALGSPGPITFGHVRIGRHGRPFRCLKFRTMVIDAEARLATILASDGQRRLEWALDHKLRDDPRITPIGGFLRRSSLDEIPQLFNVLIGHMSLVGPRPIVAAEVSRYGRHFAAYCRVRPGITGLWQVSGRNDASYRRRVALDVAYVRSKSLVLDLTILLRTIPSVLSARGCY